MRALGIALFVVVGIVALEIYLRHLDVTGQLWEEEDE